jgi:pyridoxine 5'-phosphate synthase PdxJ
MAALHAADSLDTGSTIVLRADLEQTTIDLDDHLVAVSQLSSVHKNELLQSITVTVECIEGAVARYAAASTAPDTAALEADLATVQRQLDVTSELQRRLPPQ